MLHQPDFVEEENFYWIQNHQPKEKQQMQLEIDVVDYLTGVIQKK